MTAYEGFMLLVGMLTLLATWLSLGIAFLDFLDKRIESKIKCPTCLQHRKGEARKGKP